MLDRRAQNINIFLAQCQNINNLNKELNCANTVDCKVQACIFAVSSNFCPCKSIVTAYLSRCI